MADEETVLGAQSQSDDGAASGDEETTLGGADKAGEEGAEDGTAAEGDAEQTGDAAEDEGAPDAYADFTVPEDVKLDADTLEKFQPLAKELGLSQAKAQQLVDFQVGLLQADAGAREEAFTGALSEWRTANKADAEYGGAKWDQNREAAGRLVDRFGTPELKQFLNETGAGEHPELVRFVHRMAQVIAEDTHVAGEGQGGEELTRAERMYGKNHK